MILDIILHLDQYLNMILQNYGVWTYMLLFMIIFCETGLVFTPFLPGDSILFAAGALASIGSLNIYSLFFTIFIAAVLGDTVNYAIGKSIGSHILNRFEKLRSHAEAAQLFYEKHGYLTIVLGRFAPIIRTFVPFTAGMIKMKYSQFIVNNIIGGFLWVALMLSLGFFIGELPFVKQNFSLIVIFIVLISLLPGVVTFMKEKVNQSKN
ncbi:MAG: hypothetical protein F8N38_24375 [Hungatella sp.]|nr:hypothetical protein [Hungatella sp.]